MKKPDFFIVGAPKCGTTALYFYLKQHPEIFMPDLKEPQFFGWDLHPPHRLTLEKYISLFAEVGKTKRVGEATTSYLYSKQAAKEIKLFNPSASIIIMLRNPVDMMYAFHGEKITVCAEDIDNFAVALNAEEKRKQGLCLPSYPVTVEMLFYREVAKFTQQVERYFSVFGQEQVHVIIYDDFKNDTAEVYRQTLRFLKVSSDFRPDFSPVNPSKRVRSKTLYNFLANSPPTVRRIANTIMPLRLRQELFTYLRRINTKYAPRPPMDPELQRHLQAEFATEVEKLSELLGRDLTHWTKD